MLSAKIISSTFFETITIIVIVSNSIVLALEDPTNPEETSYSKILDNTFLALYTAELILKIMGMGFIFNKGAYLRDAWNILDFIIVASAYFTLLFSSSSVSFSLSGLRAFRVLRPLRTISTIEGLKILVTALLSALPLLRDTIIILFFFFLIFAIAGVQMLHGYLKRRCVYLETGAPHQDNILCGGGTDCPPGFFCGKRFESPNGDVTNFDNMLYGILTVFQSVTLEGWSNVLVDVQQVIGVLGIFYFIPLVFIGAFFLLNLTLAVINSKFTEAHKLQTEKNKNQSNKKFKKFKGDNKDFEFIDQHISIRQYQIAKKAGKQMMKFLRVHQQFKAEQLEKQRQALDDTSRGLLDSSNLIYNQSVIDDTLSQLNQIQTPKKMLNQKMKFSFTLQATQPLPFLKNQQSDSTTYPLSLNNYGVLYQSPNNKNLITGGIMPLHQSLSLGNPNFSKQNSRLSANEDRQNEIIVEEESEEDYLDQSDNEDVQKDSLIDCDDLSQTLDNNNRNGIKVLRQSQMIEEQSKSNNSYQFRNLKMSGNWGLLTQSLKGQETLNSTEILQNPQITQINMIKQKRLDQFSDLDKFLTIDDFQPQNLNENKLNTRNNNLRNLKSQDLVHVEDDSEFIFPTQKSSSYLHTQNDNVRTIARLEFQEDSVINSDSDHITEKNRINSESRNNMYHFGNMFDQDVIILQKPIQSNNNLINKTIKAQTSIRKQNTFGDIKNDSQNKRTNLIGENQTFRRASTKLEKNFNNGDQQNLDEIQKVYISPQQIQQRVSQQIQQFDSHNNSPAKSGINDESSQLTLVNQKNTISLYKKKLALNFSTLHHKIACQLSKNLVQKTLNSKDKKLYLVKNAKYESTSENEVLERRLKNKEMRFLTDQYKFIKLPKQLEQQIDPDYADKLHIKSRFEPYQQKTIYDVRSDNEEEDDNDIDLFFKIQEQDQYDKQPFETVTGIGYSDLLQNLPTKQIARKSNIIVTSTLSFTYQPKDKPKKDRQLINESKILDEFLQNNNSLKRSNSFTQIQADKKLDNSNDDLNMNQRIQQLQKIAQMTPQIGNQRRNLPRKSIMPPVLTRLMSNSIKNDILQKQNSLTKETSKAQIKYLRSAAFWNKESKSSKQSSSPMNRSIIKKMLQIQKRYQTQGKSKLTIRDAERIFDGTFYSENEDLQAQEEVKNKNNLFKTMFQKPNLLMSVDTDKLVLKEFEKDALRQLRSQKNQENHMSQQEYTQYCEIPSELREELSLPDDLQGRDFDMNALRQRDSQFKKKNPEWSGQDVLERKPGRKQLIDNEKALWVVKHLNNIRVLPYGIRGYAKKLRVLIRKVVKSQLFQHFMIISVVINTVLLALERYNISTEEEQFLLNMNTFFSAVFILEMIFKLVAMGPRKYLSDKMNYLDGCVVIMSIIEIILNSSGNSSGKTRLSAFKTVRIFRTFRVLRVARLLRSLRSMQVIIGVIQRSVMSFVYIALLLLLFIFIYALLGMQIFGGQFQQVTDQNSANYDTFNNAFITVFQVLTIENWQTILYDSMNTNLGKIIPAIYYISWIFMGNFILLNLFLAILLDSFIEEEQDKENQEKEEEKKKEDQTLLKSKNIISRQNSHKEKQKLKEQLKLKKIQQLTKRRLSVMKMFQESQSCQEIEEDDQEQNDLEDMEEDEVHRILQQEGLGVTIKVDQNDNRKLQLDLVRLFKDRNPMRVKLFQMMKHRYFERAILTIIVFSSIKLAFDTYLLDFPSDSQIIKLSGDIDLLFTLLFTLESMIKSLSLGFIMDKGSYLRETWNILDFFIVVSSLIDLALSEINLPFIKILRLLRTLRPLRFISHNIAMKTIVVALLESIGHIINVMIVVMIVWLMFAILGVNLFAGKFFYCTINTFNMSTEAECLRNRGQWKVYDQNFDNVGNAMITLFIVATLEDWPDVMHQAVNASEENKGPILNNNPISAYYFVVFIFIGSYFLLNFFIGVLFLKYNEAQKAETKGFTQEHLHWIDMQKMITQARPDFETTNIPRQRWRKFLHRLVVSTKFDMFIMICIVLNMLQMACFYEGATQQYQDLLDMINIFLTCVFELECILKMIAFGNTYFNSSWNRFDFAVVLSSLIDLMITFMSTSNLKFLRIGPQLARVLRVIRVTRILRLIGKYQGLQALIQTITFSLPSLMNVLGLLFLIFFMFSILGVFFFRSITTGTVINEYMNFSNFGFAMLMLFRMSTGEDWNYIMFDCSRTEEDGCIEGKTCGSKIISYIYFVSFILICTDVMLNLFVLVILQQFDKYYLPANNIINLFKKDLQGFKDTWKYFSMEKYNCHKIRACQLTSFFQVLKAPLGMPNISDGELKKIMLQMGIKSDPDGYIYFNELLYRCMRRVYGQLKLNKQMQIFEIKTQYRVIRLSLMQQQKGRKLKNQEIMQLMTGKSNSVNPFLTIMFFKMAFKAWLNYAHKIKEYQRKLRQFKRKSARSSIQILDLKESKESEGLKLQIEQKENFQIEEKNNLVEFEYFEDLEILETYSSSEESQAQDIESLKDQDSSNKNHYSFNNSTQQLILAGINQMSHDYADNKKNLDNFTSGRNHTISIMPKRSASHDNNLIPNKKDQFKTIRARKNFDTIEEEEENISMPSINKKKKSDKQFNFIF